MPRARPSFFVACDWRRLKETGRERAHTNTDTLINGFILLVSNAFTSHAGCVCVPGCAACCLQLVHQHPDRTICAFGVCVRRTGPVYQPEERENPEDREQSVADLGLGNTQHLAAVRAHTNRAWRTHRHWHPGLRGSRFGASKRVAYTVTNQMLKIYNFLALLASPKPKMYEKPNFRVFYTQARISFFTCTVGTCSKCCVSHAHGQRGRERERERKQDCAEIGLSKLLW